VPRCGLLTSLVFVLAGCVNLVSPFSADLQKRASDMAADVVAWDSTMHLARKPVQISDVNQAFARWQGEVVAMLQLAAALEPASVDCSRISAAVMKDVKPLLSRAVADSLPTPSIDKAQDKSSQGCEHRAVAALADDLRQVREDVANHCNAPGLLEDDTPAATAAPKKPASSDTISMTRSCRVWFGGGGFSSGGLIVYQLVRDLGAIVYVEGRKKT
jgi:hypothetical protein